MSKHGTNVSKLIIQIMSVEAVPPGGGIASAIDFFKNPEVRHRVMKTAEEKAMAFIAAIKAAPDNPFGEDEEAIAGELLKRIEERKRR